MIVWRIEHVRSALGPYNHDAETTGNHKATDARELAYSAGVPTPWDDTQEPYLAPWRDMSPTQRHEYFFGFATRAQLRRYFTPDITRALKLLGYHVAVYVVEPQHVLAGANQVAFVKRFARRLDTAHKRAKRARGRRPRPEIVS
jgi:hypothetical protein